MSFNTAAIILPLLVCKFCILPTSGSFSPQELPVFTSDKCQEEALDISEVLTSVTKILSSNDNPTPSSHPLSCLEVKESSPGSPSGYYTLSDGTGNTNIVYCNMDELYSCPSLEQILKQVMFQQESLSQGQQLLLSGQESVNQSLAGIAVTGAAVKTLAQQTVSSQAQLNGTVNAILETTTATNSLTQQVASNHQNLQQMLDTTTSLIGNTTGQIGSIHEVSLSTNGTLDEIVSLANDIAAAQKTALYFANKTDQEVSQVHTLAYQTSIVQEAIRNDTISLVGHVAEIKSVSEQTATDFGTMTETLDQITGTLASISGKLASLDSLMADMAAQQATAMQLLNGITATTSSTSDLLNAVQQQVQHIASTQQSVGQTISAIAADSDTTSSDVSQIKTLMGTLSDNQDDILDGIDSLASTCSSGAASITLNTASFASSAFVVLAVTLFVMVTTN